MHCSLQSVAEGPAGETRDHHKSSGDAAYCESAVRIYMAKPGPRRAQSQARESENSVLMLVCSVDDVEDSSILRRGIPVANSIFGVAQTINSANYVYFKALQDLLLMQNPKLIEIFTEELLNLHRGQGMDLYWRDSLTCPSEADYLEMVGNKTGGLFRLAIKLMQAESAVQVYDDSFHSHPCSHPNPANIQATVTAPRSSPQ